VSTLPGRTFSRQHYATLQQLWADVAWLARHRHQLRQARRTLSPAFRERLMLAVTAVNRCRYCSFAHTYAALAAGVPKHEITQLLGGTPGAGPVNEAVALAYAQHWAETSGRPEPAARARLQETYGSAAADAVDVVLHMIRVGNLLGNTADYLLYRISGGRLGLTTDDTGQ